MTDRPRKSRVPRPPEALWLRKDSPSASDWFEYVEHSRRCRCLACEPGKDSAWDHPHYYVFIPASRHEQAII